MPTVIRTVLLALATICAVISLIVLAGVGAILIVYLFLPAVQ